VAFEVDDADAVVREQPLPVRGQTLPWASGVAEQKAVSFPFSIWTRWGTGSHETISGLGVTSPARHVKVGGQDFAFNIFQVERILRYEAPAPLPRRRSFSKACSVSGGAIRSSIAQRLASRRAARGHAHRHSGVRWRKIG